MNEYRYRHIEHEHVPLYTHHDGQIIVLYMLVYLCFVNSFIYTLANMKAPLRLMAFQAKMNQHFRWISHFSSKWDFTIYVSQCVISKKLRFLKL